MYMTLGQSQVSMVWTMSSPSSPRGPHSSRPLPPDGLYPTNERPPPSRMTSSMEAEQLEPQRRFSPPPPLHNPGTKTDLPWHKLPHTCKTFHESLLHLFMPVRSVMSTSISFFSSPHLPRTGAQDFAQRNHRFRLISRESSSWNKRHSSI